MPRLPRITAQQIIRILERIGFTRSRSSGSHFIYIDDSSRRVTVPAHAGKILHPKVLRNILDDSGLSVEDLLRHLNP
jgi:predicted RNA binding protein YcfA (HicA-like mRNA interferase family)